MGHSSTVWCVAFSQDGRQLASVSDDQTLRVWDLSWASSADTSPSCKLSATLSGHHSRTIYSVDWSAEGLLATGGSGRVFWRLWGGWQLARAHMWGASSSSVAAVRATKGSHSGDWPQARGAALVTLELCDLSDMMYVLLCACVLR